MKTILNALRLVVLVGFVGMWVGSAWADTAEECRNMTTEQCVMWLQVEKPMFQARIDAMSPEEREHQLQDGICWELRDQTLTSQAAAMEYFIGHGDWEHKSFDDVAQHCVQIRHDWMSLAQVDNTYIDRMDNLIMVFNEMRENVAEYNALQEQYKQSHDFAERSQLDARIKQLYQEITDTTTWFHEQGIYNYYTGDKSAQWQPGQEEE